MVEWYFGDLIVARLPALAKAPAQVREYDRFCGSLNALATEVA